VHPTKQFLGTRKRLFEHLCAYSLRHDFANAAIAASGLDWVAGASSFMRMISLPVSPTSSYFAHLSANPRPIFPAVGFPVHVNAACVDFFRGKPSRRMYLCQCSWLSRRALSTTFRRHHKDATGVEHLAIVKPDEDYEVRSYVTLEQRRRGPILLD
jgi:hypothetical protein